MSTRDSQSRKENKANLRMSGLTHGHLISQWDKIFEIGIVPDGF